MLTSSKPQDIAQVNPPSFSYAGVSPISDRDEPYESLVLGMGQNTQEKWQDWKYAAAQAVDLSVWPWCKGPEITLLTPASHDAVAGVRTFFELGTSVYCAQGRYILRRDSDATWTMVKDFGAGIWSQRRGVHLKLRRRAAGVDRALERTSAVFIERHYLDGDGDVRRAGVLHDRA